MKTTRGWRLCTLGTWTLVLYLSRRQSVPLLIPALSRKIKRASWCLLDKQEACFLEGRTEYTLRWGASRNFQETRLGSRIRFGGPEAEDGRDNFFLKNRKLVCAHQIRESSKRNCLYRPGLSERQSPSSSQGERCPITPQGTAHSRARCGGSGEPPRCWYRDEDCGGPLYSSELSQNARRHAGEEGL